MHGLSLSVVLKSFAAVLVLVGLSGCFSSSSSDSAAVAVSQINQDQTATVGSPFSYDASQSEQTFVQRDGEALTYSVTLSSPARGLQATGAAVSGSPNSAGTVSVTITATDSNGESASDQFLVVISNAPMANNVPRVSNPNQQQTATVGTAFSYDATQGGSTFSDADGDSLAYSITFNGSSNGLSASGGSINGTPNAAGTVVVTVTATDGRGGSASDSFNIVISMTGSGNSAPTVSNDNTDQTATVGVAFSYDATQSGTTFTDSDSDALSYTIGFDGASNGLSGSGGTVSGTPNSGGTVIAIITANDGNGGTASDTFNIVISAASSDVTISGKATYARVPQATVNSGAALDYNNTMNVPIRGATVEALSSTGSVLATTKTDAVGDYSVTVAANTDTRIRVKAELTRAGTPAWSVVVVDNTNSQALYVLDGSLVSSGNGNSVRNLNAPSGWGGSSYTSTRAAGPFAIMDSIYEAILKVATVDATVVFPSLTANWSVNNRPVGGSLQTGQIGTSFYSNGQLYILGAENNDTDEYDGHIVIHEWGHYFEDRLSRSDSIGGQHGGGDRLDMRVAFGEGFGNALAGIVTDDPFYRDTSGAQQANGFNFSVDDNNALNPGWYSEGSVQQILYDLYDSNDEAGVDTVSLGFGPLYSILIDEQKNTSLFTSVFTFITALKADNAGAASAIDTLVQNQNIVSSTMDPRGSTETNSAGGTNNVLPVYTNLAVNGGATNVCTMTTFGTRNKLSNRRYLTFNVTNTGTHTITATRASGYTQTDPDFAVVRNGTIVGVGTSQMTDSETASINLTASGTHIIDLLEFSSQDADRGTACFNVSVSR